MIFFKRILEQDNNKLKKVISIENNKYNYKNKFHNFMKTKKCFEKEIPQPNIVNKAKINKSVTIGICVRNCGKHCKRNFLKLNEICSIFKSSHIIFYENGSSDNSLDLIKKYCELNTHCILINESYDISKYPRTVRLARGRNICINTAKIIKNDIYITLDFDNVIKKLKVSDIEKCFKETFEWGALFANQNFFYYDLWALRTYDNWMNYDCHQAKKTLGIFNSIIKKFRIIPKKSIIKVDSAFGGFGIYKLSKINDSYYYGWKNNKQSCEHVHFNKQISKESDLYIIGYLINC